MPDHVIPPVISCLSTMEMHEATGHPGKQLSSAMGIPHPSHCEFCEQGNRKKASSTAGIKPLIKYQFRPTHARGFQNIIDL